MKSLITLLILFINLPLFAQEDLPRDKRSSFEGRHFYIGFMQNEIGIDLRTGLELRIYISSRNYANISVYVPNRPQPYQFSIANDSVLTIAVPDQVEVRQSEVPLKSLVEIISDEPITVYSFNSQYLSSDSYTAIPISHWGKEYVIISIPNDQYEIPEGSIDLTPEDSIFYLYPRSSQFMIMAAYDSTEIIFTPKAITMKGKQVDQSYKIFLNKGECYLVKSLNTQKGTGDLTGTIVRSNKPVGVLSGHVRTSVPVGLPYPYDSKDHLVEMLFPTEAWGRNFISVPFGVNLEGDLFRITSIYDNTIVNFETQYEKKIINLSSPGSFAEIRRVDVPAVWQSNKPIQIAQFMMHTGTAFDNNNYDPCMVILPPVEQYVSRIIFQTPGNSQNNPFQYIGHYISIIAHKNSLRSLRLDGQLLTSISQIGFNRIQGTDYHWARIEVQQGKHELISDTVAFSGIIYGRGRADSYGMVLGSSLINPFKKDTLPPLLTTDVDCGNIYGTIYEQINDNSSGIDFVQVIKDSTFNYIWEISQITDTTTLVKFTANIIDPFENGQFTIEFRDKNGNGKRYTYHYNGIKIDYPSQLNFLATYINEEKCLDIVLRNNGFDTIKIYSIANKDKRLIVTTKDGLPVSIPPTGKISLNVCFKPQFDSNALQDTILIDLECNIFVKIPVSAKVIVANLWTNNLDFGKVKVGETKCDTILIVNTGNVSLLINELLLQQLYNSFVVDTFSRLPYNLKSGDTLKLLACFAPDSTIDYDAEAEAINSQNIKNRIHLKGRGIAPFVESIVIDWGNRRIGTNNDTIVYLQNRGEAPADITFVRLDQSSHYEVDLNRDKLIDLNVSIPAEDSIDLSFNFIPIDTLVYKNVATYFVDCIKHPYISIKLIGQGTIPVIHTDTIYLGTHKVGSRLDTNVSLLKSIGNEELTIDHIEIYDGTLEHFEIDLSPFKNIKIDVDNELFAKIQYVPQSAGSHQIRLIAQNDAEPNFKRRVDTIIIIANAIPADTLNCEMFVVVPELIYSCNSTTVGLILKNTGNLPLELQKIEINSDKLNIQTRNYDLPIIFNPDELLNFEVEILPEISGISTVKFSVILNDTIYKEIEVKILIIDLPHYLLDPPILRALPGEVVTLELKGEILKGSLFEHLITLEIELPIENFILTNTEGTIEIQSIQGIKNYKLKFEQKSNKIICQSVDYIKIDDNVLWKIDIPLQGLLADKTKHNGLLKVSFNKCYEEQQKLMTSEIAEVCIHHSRMIKIIQNVPIFEISPNPVEDIIKIDILMDSDDDLAIQLYDLTGKKLKSENLFLKKGIHSIIFGVNNFPNAVYFLLLTTKNLTESKIIIKN